MDESIKCECGNNKFWYFGDFVRCPKCWNEYKYMPIAQGEYWLRRFNKELQEYDKNWEHWHK